MSAQPQLTAAELALIEARRAEEAATEAKRLAAEEVRNEKIRVEAQRKAVAIEEMIDALLTADTTGVLTVEDENTGRLTFEVGTLTETVYINEIETRGWYGRGTGKYQYTIRPHCDEYRTRNYTRPETLVKRIVEFQEIVEARIAAKKAAQDQQLDAVELLEETFPNAEVVTQMPCKYTKGASKYMTTYRVTTPKGTVVYYAQKQVGGGLELKRHGIEMTVETADEVAAMILRG